MYEQYVAALMNKIEEAYLANHVNKTIQQISRRAWSMSYQVSGPVMQIEKFKNEQPDILRRRNIFIEEVKGEFVPAEPRR